MNSEKKRHIHKYKKRNLGSKEKPYNVYSCVECTHYLRPEIISGKIARCFKCDSEFIIKANQVNKMSKLRCAECIGSKKETIKHKEKVDSLFDKLMNEI